MGKVGNMRNLVTLYSRHGCHLCEVALEVLERLAVELDFEVETIFIEDDPDLVEKHGEFVPVIYLDGEPHDFYRVNVERFRTSLAQHRLHQ